MRIFFASIAMVLFAGTVNAADVICKCTGKDKCADIKISFVPSNPGVYMNVEYAYGDRNMEGFARIIRLSEAEVVRYYLGHLILEEAEGKYSLPGRPHKCD